MPSVAGGPLVGFDWLLDAILTPLAIVDHDLRLVAVNDAYCMVGGRTRERLVGVRLIEAFPENPDDPEDTGPRDLRESLLRVLESGSAEMMPLQRYDVQEIVDGPFIRRFWSITTSPVRRKPDGPIEFAVIHAEEVTSFIDERLRRAATGEGSQTAGQTEAIDTVFGRALRHSATLNSFAEALVKSSTSTDVARAFIGAGIDFVGGSGGAFVTRDGDRLTILGRRGINDVGDAWTSFPLAAGRDPFSDAIVLSEPLLFANRAQFLAAYPSMADQIMATDNHAWAVLPLSDGTSHLGALGVTFEQPDLFSTLVQLDLQNLAALTSQAMSRTTLLADQTATIESIIRVLEADLDDPSTVATEILYRPAASLPHSGGDWFDIISTDDRRTVLAIGDIAAHGAGTTGEMLRARATLQSHALQNESSSEIASRVSATLHRFTDTFATACIVVYDADEHTLTWTNAGHPYPLLITTEGDIELLRETHGPPLGIRNPNGPYGRGQRMVGPGDTLVLYTDGLIERRTEDLEASFNRLIAETRRAPDRHLLAEHLYRSLIPDGVHADDVAILIATIRSV